MTDSSHLQRLVDRADALLARIEQVVPRPLAAPDWAASTAFRYRKRGGSAALEPVRHVASIALDALVEVEDQKQKLVRNTEQFVAGRGANNVLLTGSRGTGKSSLIKACLNAFAARGLRLIEVDKADLVDLPDIVDLVADRPERFVVFCDDLSFDDGEPGYKALKSILDGSVAETSENVLVYATSNRRHLLPEHMKDNLSYEHTEDGEVHPGEVIEEKISLSERFGLWISFYPFSQDEYLAIVAQWLRGFGVPRSGDRRSPASVAGLGAGARFALGARRLPVREGLRRPGGHVSDGSAPEGTVERDPPVSAAEERVAVDVAVGVLIDAEGRFLMTSRPEGKVYAGYWEFPGGKLESGESVEAALRRELHEELGITIGAVEPWQVTLMDYAHARVRLHFCKVRDWAGDFEMREQQAMAWQSLPVEVVPVLPGTLPVLGWFASERGFVGATHRS